MTSKHKNFTKGTAMKNRKELLAYGILALIFMMLQLACSMLEKSGNVTWNITKVLVCLAISLCFSIAVVFLISAAQKLLSPHLPKGKEIAPRKGCLCFLLSLGGIFLCWIPVFLAYYPGILAYDSYVQLEQIRTTAYNNHHPLAHTLLIKGFLKLGDVLGSANTGVALYTMVQMLALSAVMGYGICFLQKRGVNRFWLTLLILYCGLCPSNSFLAVSMTKDVFFTVFVLLFILLFLTLTEKRGAALPYHVIFILSATGIVLFRNNGKYALLLFAGCYLLYVLFSSCKREKKFLLLLGEMLLSLLLGSALLVVLNSCCGAQDADRREMLSVPIQQLARTMVYHGGTGLVENGDDSLSAEDKALINEFILNEGYLQYDPLISDPVKRCTNTWVVLHKTKDFLKLYLGLFWEYPSEYVNAFLMNNGGYLAVSDKSHAQINLSETETGLGYLQTRWEASSLKQSGIYQDSKWQSLHERLEDFAGNNRYLDSFLLRILIAPGIYLWCYLLLGIRTFFKRENLCLLPLFFVAGYYATLLFGPTVQLRYLYPVMLLLPFYLLYLLYGSKQSAQSICGTGQKQQTGMENIT